MATNIYENNNPGNITYWSSSGIEGVDYYLGKKGSGIKYKKFNTKSEGLSAILDTMYNYANTDIDKIMESYASTDKSGKVIDNYGEQLRNTYNIAKDVNYNNNEQLLEIMKGVTHFENSANSQDYKKHYLDKDYDDALKMFQEKRLLDRGTVSEQIKDAEMQGLNLNG